MQGLEFYSERINGWMFLPPPNIHYRVKKEQYRTERREEKRRGDREKEIEGDAHLHIPNLLLMGRYIVHVERNMNHPPLPPPPGQVKKEIRSFSFMQMHMWLLVSHVITCSRRRLFVSWSSFSSSFLLFLPTFSLADVLYFFSTC